MKNEEIRKDLKGHARSLRALLPAFCRHPVDADKNIGALCKIMITFIRKHSHMHSIIAIAVKVSVHCSIVHICHQLCRALADFSYPEDWYVFYSYPGAFGSKHGI